MAITVLMAALAVAAATLAMWPPLTGFGVAAGIAWLITAVLIIAAVSPWIIAVLVLAAFLLSGHRARGY